ncbi:MAG: hypothetical protein HKN25_10960, partial [Pyrinomonadaceae bacterium]|nr:hypothetical protein [Pyrinomonadaceae bacterium]
SGAILGLASLVRGTLAPFVLVLAFGFALSGVLKGKLPAVVLRRTAIFVIAFLIIIFPWLARNRLVAGQWFFGASSTSLYVSIQQYSGEKNIIFSSDDWNSWQKDRAKRYAAARVGALGEIDVDRSYGISAYEEFTKLEIGDVARNGIKKVFYLWGGGNLLKGEFSKKLYTLVAGLSVLGIILCLLKIISFRTFGFALAGVLYACSLYDFYLGRGLVLHSFLIFAFVVAGIWNSRVRIWQHWLLWLPAVYLTLAHLVFHVEARYSFPARPFLIVFAAVGLSLLFPRLLGFTMRPDAEN